MGKKMTIFIFLCLMLITIIVELLRLENANFRKFFFFIFGVMLRKHEINNFTGASYLLISAIVCVAFFPAEIAFLAMSFLSIGDTMAALMGIHFGKRKFINSPKSFEGFLACFASTFLFGCVASMLASEKSILTPNIAFWGALTASIAELINIPIDDNVKIPILSGIAMCIAFVFS
jgi:dolichol kinase